MIQQHRLVGALTRADYSEGQHTIKVVAYDSLGETATQEMPEDFVEFPLLFVTGIISLYS